MTIAQRKLVQLNTIDIEWFEKEYEGATLSWVLSLLLQKFREAHTHTPADYAAIAAKELEEELSDTG